ncbi:MAG: glucose-1-phosphate adenylyltransferase subunit GlgD [Oscillospiraceae bacterium]|jgi:glucose-1-phosphate adenylyltransferase|nr:glucose-1-phosphate adenylyltransferase subunit GlgD [Oscillospiraceae bacterium]
MKDVMGVIYTGENDARLRELTLVRAVAALPVGGRYRVIDFAVSSMVNSGIRHVGVITQKNYHSLMDHLGSGKEWDLHGKNDGLTILPPFLTRENIGVYSGLIDALYSHAGYMRRSRQELVLLATGHTVFNEDFTQMQRFHAEREADITLLYSDDPALRKITPGSENSFFSTDEEGRVTGIEIDPMAPARPHAMLEVCLLKRELLRYLVDQSVANGLHDFGRDIIQRAVNDGNLRVFGYPLKNRAWRMDSVQNYFQFNMDLLDSGVRGALFAPDSPIYTKLRDDMPARYGAMAQVSDSLVADGCIVEGTVSHSILFRGVRVARGAVVKNSILLQDAEVQADTEIDHCILDKQSVIKRNGRLIGPAAYPIVIAKDVVI